MTKLVSDKQFSAFNSTEKDKYKVLDKNLQIVAAQLNVFGTVPFESYYNLKTSDASIAVTYNINDDVATRDDRSLVFWVSPKASDNAYYDVELIQEDGLLTIPANYRIRIKSPKKAFNVGDVFNVGRPGSLSFYTTVIDVNNTNGDYYVLIDASVITYLKSVKSNWESARNYKMQVKQPINVLTGSYETNESLSIDIYDNKYMKIVYGSQQHIAILDEKLSDDSWYGGVINIGNTWGQHNVSIWKQNDTDVNGDKLKNLFTETIKFTSEEILVDEYTIDRSDS